MSLLTCSAGPRSGNGSSIRSKSRGTIVFSKAARASSLQRAHRVARGDVGQRQQPHLGVRGQLRPPPSRWSGRSPARARRPPRRRWPRAPAGRPAMATASRHLAGRVSPAITTLRPRAASPSTCSGVTSPTASPLLQAPEVRPGRHPELDARAPRRSAPAARPRPARSPAPARRAPRRRRRACSPSRCSSSPGFELLQLHLERKPPDHRREHVEQAAAGRAGRGRCSGARAPGARRS